jgi:hypothetical protein
MLFHCSDKEGRLQEPCEFPESANNLFSTSVYINQEFWKPTTSMCSQEDKENSEYENVGNANVAASSLMLFHCSDKESRLQELYEFPESAATPCLQLLFRSTVLEHQKLLTVNIVNIDYRLGNRRGKQANRVQFNEFRM